MVEENPWVDEAVFFFSIATSSSRSPPTFLASPTGAKVLESSDVTLDCAANGSPPPFITWLKDGVAVDLSHLDSRFSVSGAGSLRIRSARVADAGTYQCRAENSEDSRDAAAVLEVRVPPRMERAPRDAAAAAKGDIELECEVFGVPEPTVQWYKNGDLIIESDYFQVSNFSN